MNLTSPKDIKELLEKYDAKPSKGLGQNFLIDKNILDKIVNSADIKPTDNILEVGPGVGTLTIELAKKAKQVYAIEKDKRMIEILKETLSEFKNIEVINADILKFQVSSLKVKSYKIVANIPYYLTSPLIRKFLEMGNHLPAQAGPEEIVLMMQKEVAQRICAKPPKMSLLAISVQFYATPKIISYVSKSCFMPAPKIDSAIIKITPARIATRSVAGGPISPDLFFKIVKAGFSHARKQLVNNLSNTLEISREQTENWLIKNNIKPNQRAETLSVEDWKNLASSL